MPCLFLRLWLGCFWSVSHQAAPSIKDAGVRVGTAAVELVADDAMVIAGGIHAGQAKGQEGLLRAVAMVLEKDQTKVVMVSLDVLMMTRHVLDPILADIQKECGIPPEQVMIHCTHTHHAPSTLRLHDYQADPRFIARVHRATVQAVQQANAALSEDSLEAFFSLGREETVGRNSRQMLTDGSIYWIGRREFVRPTGPFDSQLPVMGFRSKGSARDPAPWKALWFNHSTHTIGTLRAGVRSPSFYGLAAQQLEADLGAHVLFLEGASGSTHNLDLSCQEATHRMVHAVQDALNAMQPAPMQRLAAIKRSFTYRVRHFDEAAEHQAVSDYCTQWVGPYGRQVIPVFKAMRDELAPHQGEERETWIQAMLLGDVAMVAVPAEFFTQLGLDIKERSPFKKTFVAELSNDWIGYLPDLEAHRLGGYQVWTGYHSYCEPGTGERMVDEVLQLLEMLKQSELP